MQKKLLFNIVLLLMVNLLVKPFWILGIDRSFQNQIGYNDYGLYINMFSISMILTMLLDFGINNFNSATIANNPEKVSEQFSSLFALKLILSSCYFLFTFILAYLYGYRGYYLLLILLLGMNQVTAHFSTFVRSCITGLQYFKTDALLSAVDRFVMILLGLIMLSGLFVKVSIPNFIGIQTIGYLVVVTVGLLVLSPKLRYFKLNFDWPLLKSLFIKTVPYALLAFIMLLYTRADVLLIKKLLINGDFENGIYASGGRLLEAANMMIGATAVIMLPFFARMIAANENLTSISQLLSTLLLLPVVLFSLFCHTYSHEIMQILSPGSSDYTAQVFSILILCFIPYGFMYTYGSMLTAKAEMKILNVICGTALVVNIVLNLFVIPRYGALGAAYVALITQLIVGFGKFTFAIFKLKLEHNTLYYFKFFGLMLFLYFLLFQAHAYQINLLYSLLLGGSVTVLWIITFRMVNLKGHLLSTFQNFKSFKK